MEVMTRRVVCGASIEPAMLDRNAITLLDRNVNLLLQNLPYTATSAGHI
jgi:hypothetical protein